ncbi:lipoprotein [Congregibacter variabilis]|uniref:Lipoprotein n=1 Tax=Congregibacter variabilis TaxID=3081200 RepID=A0ABZ0HXU3_9GAMM|nr:lipoprotein [Congregibacter sp. IMCC43200]
MEEPTFILPSFLRGGMKHIRTATVTLACAMALSLTGCGQMGDLYQPLPEPTQEQQPTAATSSGEDAAGPGRGD